MIRKKTGAINLEEVEPYGLPAQFEQLVNPPAQIGLALVKQTVPWKKIAKEYKRTKRVTTDWQVVVAELDKSLHHVPSPERKILLSIAEHVTIEPPGSPYYGKVYPTLSEWFGTVSDFTMKDIRTLLFCGAPDDAFITIEGFDRFAKFHSFEDGDIRLLRVNLSRPQKDLEAEFKRWLQRNRPRPPKGIEWEAFYNSVRVHYLRRSLSQSKVGNLLDLDIDTVRKKERQAQTVLDNIPLMFAPKYR